MAPISVLIRTHDINLALSGALAHPITTLVDLRVCPDKHADAINGHKI